MVLRWLSWCSPDVYRFGVTKIYIPPTHYVKITHLKYFVRCHRTSSPFFFSNILKPQTHIPKLDFARDDILRGAVGFRRMHSRSQVLTTFQQD